MRMKAPGMTRRLWVMTNGILLTWVAFSQKPNWTKKVINAPDKHVVIQNLDVNRLGEDENDPLGDINTKDYVLNFLRGQGQVGEAALGGFYNQLSKAELDILANCSYK